jgi:hypothetical protein
VGHRVSINDAAVVGRVYPPDMQGIFDKNSINILAKNRINIPSF